MNKFVLNVKKFWKVYLAALIISIIVGVVIFVIFFFVNNQTIIAAVNGTTIAFVVLFACGILAFVARSGMFDSLSYGFNQMFSSMFAKKANKYNDFNAYKEDKITKRSSSPSVYIVIILASLLFAIAMLVLYIIIRVKGLY